MKVENIIKYNQPKEYEKLAVKRVPEWIIRVDEFLDKLTEKPAEMLLKLRGMIK